MRITLLYKLSLYYGFNNQIERKMSNSFSFCYTFAPKIMQTSNKNKKKV